MRECPRKYFILIFHIFKKSKCQQLFFSQCGLLSGTLSSLFVSLWDPSVHPTSTKECGQQGQNRDEQQCFLEPATLLQSLAGALSAHHLSKYSFRGDKEELHTPLCPQRRNALANSLRARVGGWKGSSKASLPDTAGPSSLLSPQGGGGWSIWSMREAAERRQPSLFLATKPSVKFDQPAASPATLSAECNVTLSLLSCATSKTQAGCRIALLRSMWVFSTFSFGYWKQNILQQQNIAFVAVI